MDVCRLLSALLMVVIHSRAVWSQGSCDQCDCQLSSDDDKERAILSVKTRCAAGTIDWTIAYGAIRLEVTPPSPRARDYRLCFVVHSRHTLTQVSQETLSWRRPKPRNYRLGQEGEEERVRSLNMMTPLVRTSGEEGESPETCVTGRSGRSVWLFVEVERTTIFTGIPSVTLRYDVEPLSDSALLDPMEDCRPCTQEEVLEAYCTSDFVAVGSIQHTQQPDEAGQHTQIQVSVAQLIHQNSPVFHRVRRDDRFLHGTIHAPARCGIRPGQGDFLFTGRMRLGKPKLRCAPFFQDWLKISSQAECVYN